MNIDNKSVLNVDEAIKLASVVASKKPVIPIEIGSDDISTLIDDLTVYKSINQYKISIYFRETNLYVNDDGYKTYGDFKNLYKIRISRDQESIYISDIYDFITTFIDIITSVYNASIVCRLDDERVGISDLSIDNKKAYTSIGLNVKILN